jgi:hypothetical protein
LTSRSGRNRPAKRPRSLRRRSGSRSTVRAAGLLMLRTLICSSSLLVCINLECSNRYQVSNSHCQVNNCQDNNFQVRHFQVNNYQDNNSQASHCQASNQGSSTRYRLSNQASRCLVLRLIPTNSIRTSRSISSQEGVFPSPMA